MPVVVIPQYGFVKGLLGSAMKNRDDLDLFRYGGLQFINYNILPTGPITKSRGFKNLATLTGAIRLFTFSFSDTQEYIFIVKNLEIDVYTANDNTYRATITTPWTTAQVEEIKWTQSFDTLIVSQEDQLTQSIVRGATHASWTISDYAFEEPPFDRFNVIDDLTPSGTTGSINLTMSASYWVAGHVGVQIRTNGGLCTINSITSGTVAAATVDETLTGTGADLAWREEVFTAVHGYARVPVIYQSRLIFCGSRDLPQSLWGSKTGDINNFNAEDVLDDNAFALTLNSGVSEPIYDALVRGTGTDANLQVFTSQSEWVIEGQPLTPTSASAKVQTAIGSSSRTRPIEVQSQTFFSSGDGKAVYDFAYEFDSNSFKNANMNLLTPTIISNPLDLVYLRNYKDTQSDRLYVLNDDGNLAVLTTNKKKEVLGWSTRTTNGTINSITVADNTLKLIVTRDNGTYLEELTEDDVYLDSYTTLTSGTAKTSWTGATIVANQTIRVLADGFPESVVVDGAGAFSTADTTSTVIVGYNYTSLFESMPLIFTINGKNVRGERVRKIKVNINVESTEELIIDAYNVPLREFGDALLDAALPSITDAVIVHLTGTSGNPTLQISSDEPLPQTVVGYNIYLRSGS